MIIGITGLFGSGKSTASKFFQKKGYKILSLSSFLIKEAQIRGLQITRKNLQDLGNELRAKNGSGVLMRMALSELNGDKIVIDGIRNLGEVEELRKVKGSILLAVVADRKVRIKRLQNSKKEKILSEDKFRELDLRDLGVNEKITGLQTAFCIAMSDAYVVSSDNRKEVESDLQKFLDNYGK